MRLYKSIFIGILITCISVAYVHQRVEIIKMGYGLQNSRIRLSRLVDQNTKLMYNLSKLESPRNLLAAMSSEEIEFAGRRAADINEERFAEVATEKSGAGDGFFIKFLDLFTLSAEAKPRK